MRVGEHSATITILPTTTFEECPQLDVLCVPGGVMGTVEMMRDTQVLSFLQQQGKTAKYITAVCTVSLILAAAGLLQGDRAATHWAFREQLEIMGAQVKTERVVVDGNRITGGGVTAGIDFALTIAGILCGKDTAKFIELMLEYNPSPPFGVGSPEKAGDRRSAKSEKYWFPVNRSIARSQSKSSFQINSLYRMKLRSF